MLAGFHVPQDQSRGNRTLGRRRIATALVNGVARVSNVAKAKLVNQMNQSFTTGNNEAFKQSLESAITILSREPEYRMLKIIGLRRAISAIKLDQYKDDSKIPVPEMSPKSLEYLIKQ